MPAENTPLPEDVTPATSEVVESNDPYAFFDEGSNPPERAESPSGAELPPPPAPPAPATFSHPRWLEREAIALDIPDDEILTTPTDALQQKVAAIQRQQIAELKRRSEQADVRSKPQAEAPVELPPPVEEEVDLELDAGVWDEKFTKQWNALVKANKAQAEEIKALKAGQQHVQQHVQMTEAERFQQTIESKRALRSDLFGTGPIETGSPEDLKLQAVLSAMERMSKSPQRTTFDNDWDKVVTALYGATPTSPPPPAAKPDPDRDAIKDAYRNGGLNRPTQRNATPLPRGRSAAVAAANEWAAKNRNSNNGTGITYDDDDDVKSGLPD